MSLGERIRTARKKQKFPQQMVASALNVTVQAVSQWENDKTRPTYENVIQLATLLSVEVEYFSGETKQILDTTHPRPDTNKGRRIPVISLAQAFLYGWASPEGASVVPRSNYEYIEKSQRTLEPTSTNDAIQFCIQIEKDLSDTGLRMGDYAIFDTITIPQAGEVIACAVLTSDSTTKSMIAITHGVGAHDEPAVYVPASDPAEIGRSEPLSGGKVLLIGTLVEVRRRRLNDQPIKM